MREHTHYIARVALRGVCASGAVLAGILPADVVAPMTKVQPLPLYGYARVSTRDQDLALQLNELTSAGCAKVFKEKASGARSDRPELAKVMSRLAPGDVLAAPRLDRLARSTRDLLNVLDELAKRGAGFRSLKDSWADTTTPHGKLMVTVLGGLAELERELIRA